MKAQGLVPPGRQVSVAGAVAGAGWRVFLPLPQESWCPAWELAWLWLVDQPLPCQPWGWEELLLLAQGPFVFHLAAHTDRHEEWRKPWIWTGLELSAESVHSTVSKGSCLSFFLYKH